MTTEVFEKFLRVSTKPGVYLMKNNRGDVIYVGKARNLKKRLSSYFNKPSHPDMKTGVLIKQISDFDTIITATEKEAFILESNLIKRYRPRYNVVLKDDKRYPVLRLDSKLSYPNLTVVRKIQNDGALYFGPYASAHAVRQTIKFIDKTFKLRKCRSGDVKPRSRPCLHYQLGRCLAPCCVDVPKKDYDKIVKEVILFLKGRTPELIRNLKKEMQMAAKQENFERAANLRDKIIHLKNTLEKQVSVTTDFIDRDVLGIARSDGRILITHLLIRSGYLLGSRNFNFSEDMGTTGEILEAFIRQHYEKGHMIPKELLVSQQPVDSLFLEEWLSSIKQQSVKIIRPQKGEKVRLIEMAQMNAEVALKELLAAVSEINEILSKLAKSLKMKNVPERIECFDNSNISGTEAVAGMVVFEMGRPKKSAYRKFKIKTVEKHNDYAYMKEVLKRRFAKEKKQGNFPDLLVVDGGRGQLNIAVTVLKELNLSNTFHVIGIAKKDEKKGEKEDKIYVPGRSNPVPLFSDTLLLLQRIRDEAHRFAVTFHRNRRKKTAIHSVLDDIPGIGINRKRTLLKQFKSIANIRSATLEELRSVSGMNKKAAQAVHDALAGIGNQ
jgi:excinuclease ABC subunit C